MALIRNLKNFFTGNIIFPITKTRAVYDDEGRRLDQYLDEIKVGSNILINGNFRNPVNQRLESTKTTSGYWIDRWELFSDVNSSDVKGVVNDGYITVSKTSTNIGAVFIRQFLEFPNTYRGKAITVSFKCRTSCSKKLVVRWECSHDLTSSRSSVCTVTNDGEWHEYSYIIHVPESNVTKLAPIVIGVETETATASSDKNLSIDIEYIKAEYGEVSTPFVPRLYQEELLLCKRFLQPLKGVTRVDGYSSNTFCTHVPLEVEMRCEPTATLRYPNLANTGGGIMLSNFGGVAQYGFTFDFSGSTTTVLAINATKTGHGLTDGKFIYNNTNCILCEAEI